MPLVLIVLVWSLVGGVLMESASNLMGVYRELNARLVRLDIEALAPDIRRYRRENNAWPVDNPADYSDLSGLTGSAGYVHHRHRDRRPNLRYVEATGLVDSVETFDRAVLYIQGETSRLTDTQYLSAAANACGADTFAASESWCGVADSYYIRMETREDIQDELHRARIKLDRLVARAYKAYALNGNAFPRGGLADGASDTLVNLSGYGGTNTNCTDPGLLGTVDFDFLPLGCEDLYSLWGTPVIYYIQDDNNIMILARSPYLDSAGNAVLIGSIGKVQ